MNIFRKFDSLIERFKKFSPLVVRIGLSLVFLWFGSQQLLHTEAWTGLIPKSILSISGMSALSFVYFNGIFEIVFSILLILGLFTRLAALLLALHLLNIIFVVGYSDIAVRDFGLAMAGISIFLSGADAWCLDKIFIRREGK